MDAPSRCKNCDNILGSTLVGCLCWCHSRRTIIFCTQMLRHVSSRLTARCSVSCVPPITVYPLATIVWMKERTNGTGACCRWKVTAAHSSSDFQASTSVDARSRKGIGISLNKMRCQPSSTCCLSGGATGRIGMCDESVRLNATSKNTCRC